MVLVITMEDTTMTLPYDISIEDQTTVSENGTRLQHYRISNEYVPDFLIHTLPIVYFALGACLNATLFTYVVMSGRWKSPIFTVVASLAITDTMVCVASVLWASFVFPVITHTNLWWMCHLSIFLGFGGMGIGGGILMFFAALRFYQLKYPLSAHARVTCKFVLKWLALVWSVYLNYSGILWGIMYRPKHVLISGKVELICEQIGNVHSANIAFLILDTIIPCVTIAVLHLSKYFTVARSQKDLEESQQQKRLNTDARAVSIVILMFIICWVPLNLYPVTMGTVSSDYHMFQDKLYIIFIFVTACNSTFNPIIYCIAAKTVRDDFIRFLRCRGKSANERQI